MSESPTLIRKIFKHPILLTIFALVAGFIGWSVHQSKQPKPIPIRVAKVTRTEKLVQQATASGEIRAHDMVDIQTEIPGIIVELPVKEGQKVKRGELLLRIDPFQYQMALASDEGRFHVAQAEVKSVENEIENKLSEVERLKEMLKSCESDLEQARITAARDKSSFNRYEELFKKRVISGDEYETFEAKLRISNKRVDSARASIEQINAQIRAAELSVAKARILKKSAENSLAIAEASLKQAQDNLSKTNLRSPMDGVIVKLNVDRGERAVPGIQSNPQATLMTIADLSVIEAEIKVDETDIVRLALGQPVSVKVDALQAGMQEELSLAAQVTEIANAPIDTQGSNSSYSMQQEGRDFKVVATISKPPAEVRIGMLCEAKITNATRENLVTIPIQAVTTREVEIDKAGRYAAPPKPDPNGGKGDGVATKALAADTPTSGTKKTPKKELQGVFVKDADGFARFRQVKTGVMDDTNVEVLDGLKEGEEVIIGPLASLRKLDEWALVKIEENPSDTQFSNK